MCVQIYSHTCITEGAGGKVERERDHRTRNDSGRSCTGPRRRVELGECGGAHAMHHAVACVDIWDTSGTVTGTRARRRGGRSWRGTCCCSRKSRGRVASRRGRTLCVCTRVCTYIYICHCVCARVCARIQLVATGIEWPI